MSHINPVFSIGATSEIQCWVRVRKTKEERKISRRVGFGDILAFFVRFFCFLNWLKKRYFFIRENPQYLFKIIFFEEL